MLARELKMCIDASANLVNFHLRSLMGFFVCCCRDLTRRMASSKSFEDYPGTESGDVHETPPTGYRKPVSVHNVFCSCMFNFSKFL